MIKLLSFEHVSAMMKALEQAGFVVEKHECGYECKVGDKTIWSALRFRHGQWQVLHENDLFKRAACPPPELNCK
jgi:hypothetical protein